MSDPAVVCPLTGSPVVCPLTGAPDVALIQHIPTRYLIDRYRRDLDIDLGDIFDGLDRIGFYESRATGLKFFTPAFTAPPDIYANLRQQGWYDPPDKFEFTIGAAAVKPGDRVLDIGSGAGHFARHVAHADYVGIDTATGAAKPEPGSFDVVTAFQVLEHVADPPAFLRDAMACLKPGGRLVIGVPDSESYLGTLANFVLNAPPHHVTWWNARALTALAEIVGLEDVQLHHAPVEPWEARLYRMAQVQRRLRPRGAALFEDSWWGRVVTVGAYMVAGAFKQFPARWMDRHGATTVLVARKIA